MEQAIKKAIEGGYTGNKLYEGIGDIVILDMAKKVYLLDPLFWQALGKALGWKEMCLDCGSEVTRKETPEYPNLPHGISYCNGHCYDKNYTQGWTFYWHRFIDRLAEGGNAEDFFKDLLTK